MPLASRFIPSKRISALAIVIGAVIVTVLILRFVSRESETQNAAESPVFVAKSEVVTETDTDGDGLKDWEEALWNMSPTTPDTDGDGTLDAAEVANQRAAAEEAREESLLGIAASLEASAADENLSKTDLLARALLEQVVAFKNAGISIDANVAGEVSNTLGKTLLTDAPDAPTVTLNDLVIAESPTNDDIRTYGNTIGAALAGPSTEKTNELFVLAEFGQSNDSSVLSKLTPVADHYTSIAALIADVPVPTNIVRAHLAFVNATHAVATSLRALGTLSSDSLGAILALQLYVDASATFYDSFQALKAYLTAHKSLFFENDPAFILINLQ
ncbi:MAG: hypothetical protein AAB460_01240 [Patescibacteria group bacterium]